MHCNENITSEVCFLPENYQVGDPPRPYPTIINTTINLKDIVEVDLERKTITMSLKMVLEWTDMSVSILQTKEDLEK